LAQNGPQPAGAGPGGPGRGPAQPAWKRPGAPCRGPRRETVR